MTTLYTQTGSTSPVGSSWKCPTCKRPDKRANEVDTHMTDGTYLGSMWLCYRCASRKHGESIREVAALSRRAVSDTLDSLRQQLTGEVS